MNKTKKIKVIKLNYKKKRKNKKTRKIKCDNYIQPKNFIFGYGSLINSYSRKYTGKGYIGSAIPIELSKAGYQRIWVCKKVNMEIEVFRFNKNRSRYIT